MAGFRELAIRLQAPDLATFGARTPKVSGYMPEYSRFRETATGDRFRSTLRGGPRTLANDARSLIHSDRRARLGAACTKGSP
jgi:hypothetical protein